MDTSKMTTMELAKQIIEIQAGNINTMKKIIEQQKELIEMLKKQLDLSSEHMRRR